MILKEDESLWKFKAHKQAVTSLAFNNGKPEIFATSSLDRWVKIWKQENSECKPKLMTKKQSHSDSIGAIFSIEFAPKPSIPTVLIMGGLHNFGMWDIQSVLDHTKIDLYAPIVNQYNSEMSKQSGSNDIRRKDVYGPILNQSNYKKASRKKETNEENEEKTWTEKEKYEKAINDIKNNNDEIDDFLSD